MVRKLGITISLLCVLCVSNSKGQSSADSVLLLKTVVVTQSRLSDYVIAAYELPIDSTMLSIASNGSLTDLLRKQGLGHIRSYGPGGLASPSFRGTGSSHTAILWNGINLVSPLSGQLDLSLVPAGLFDDATIQTGGATSLSGNGSIGANIHLNNNARFGEGLGITAASHIGSFGSKYFDAGVKFSNRNFGISTKLFITDSDNDFRYMNRNTSKPEIMRRQHSAFTQHGLLQQAHWRSEEAGIFSVKFWYQQSLYEIPNSLATEDNEFYRVLGGWNYSRKNIDINYQGAFIRQDLNYTDPLLDLESLNRNNSTIQNLEGNFHFNDSTLLTSGVQYTWEEGIADDFGAAAPSRNRIALFSAFKFNPFEKWDFAVSAREEIVNGVATPFAPSVSAKFNAHRKLNIFTNLSRNYRIPTFNDLYWIGAGAIGNPDLKTETSLSSEAGLSFANETISFKSVVFNNHVDNWIQWKEITIVREGQPLRRAWTPLNIKKVWSRGLESQLSLKKRIGQVQSRLTGQYSFTKSTNEDIYADGNPNEVGKQLLLTPLHEGSATVEMSWKKFAGRIVTTYTGMQYNTADNQPGLAYIVKDYLITNVWLSKTMMLKAVQLTFTGEINNIFNVEYVARPGYPMPLRNYKAGIQFNFNKPNKR